MDWARTGWYWVERGLDGVGAGLRTITDPRWLLSNPGWAAFLGLGVVLLVGWVCLYTGKRR